MRKKKIRKKEREEKNCDLIQFCVFGEFIRFVYKKFKDLSANMPDTEIELIDKNNLISELRSNCNPNKKEIIILDCRSANDYAVNHIKNAANISIPTIMLRRLKEGEYH